MRTPPRSSIAIIAALGLIAAVLLIGASFSSAPRADAGGPVIHAGLNCSLYTPASVGHNCTIQVGDMFFCDAAFHGRVCLTVVTAGDTINWDFSGASLQHSATACGLSCDHPTMSPVFDSGIGPPTMYELPTPFDTSVTYLYHCRVHPDVMKGIITILGTPPGPAFGDVNCSASVNSIDAALELQLGAGLVNTLSCQQFADVNLDGHINSIDTALILQFSAGLINRLPT